MEQPFLKFTDLLKNSSGESSRSEKVKKNIFLSFILQFISIGTNFLLVPLTLHYLDTERYGIWLTLSSIVSWISFLDIGLGNGLRNKFAEAVAKKELHLARMYVSSTYALLSVIISAMFILFLFAQMFLPWTSILNTHFIQEDELSQLIVIVVAFFSLQFITKTIGTIVTADQRPAMSNLFNVLTNILSLVAVYTLTQFSSGSLLLLGTIISVMPVIVYVIANIILFSGQYKLYAPTFSLIDFRAAKELMSLGVQFFILQFVAVIIFSTDNIIITQLFGPAEVTIYNIAYKYFSLVTIFFGIITAPFWSAATDAYAQMDFEWMKRKVKQLMMMWGGIVVLVILMIAFSPFIYDVWIGNNIHIPMMLSIFMGIFVLLNTWNSIFTNFVNGVGKIRLSLFTALITGSINIPLSILFAKYFGLGSAGVILATCVCQLVGVVLRPLQFLKIINKTDFGIWGK